MNDIMINSKTISLRFHNGIAYYALVVPYSETLYGFPVALNNTKDETLTAECNSIYFIDYMQKAIR